MKNYTLSTSAKVSLKDIRKYSLKHFGKKRTVRYLQTILEKMESLNKKPLIGVERSDIFKDRLVYSSLVEMHIIYYQIAETHIEIADILHQSMGPKRHIFLRN